MKSFFIAIFIFLVLSATGYSQQYPMLHYTLENGLPSKNVYSIYKAHDGYLWFATDKGVARYNGLKFEIFTTENGLADNEVFFFKEDYSGRLWMATYNGNLCYFKNEKVYTAQNDATLKLPFKSPFIEEINVEQDSSIIIFFHDRRKFINIYHDHVIVHTIPQINYPTQISDLISITKHNSNNYEIQYRHMKISIDSASRVTHTEVYNIRFNPCKDRIHNYLYSENAIYSMDRKKLFQSTKNFSLTENYLYAVYYDGTDYMMGTNHGLFINNNIYILEHLNITSILQDDQKNYWVSTLEDGVYFLDKDFKNERIYTSGFGSTVKFSQYNGNKVFFSTIDNNFYKIADEENIKKIFDYKSYKKLDNLKYPLFSGFCIDEYNNYYAYYNGDKVKVSSIDSDHPAVKVNRNNLFDGIKAIYTSQGYNYILLPRYIVRATENNNSRSDLVNCIDHFKVTQWPFSMTKSSDNVIWYSKLDSIYKIIDGKPIPQSQFKNIVFKWFDIYGNYLVGCSIENKLVISNNVSDGRSFKFVSNQKCIWNKSYRLDSSHILLSTNNVYRVLAITSGSDSFNYRLTALETPILPQDAESICADNENCYFFKENKIVCIPIAKLFDQPIAPSVHIISVNSPLKKYSLDEEIIIPNSEAKNLNLPFSVISFDSKILANEYSLSNSASTYNWTSVEGNEINLLDANYGTYFISVRVKGLNNYSNIATVKITILKPFWATVWFTCLSILALIILTSLGINIGVKRTLRKRETAHKIKISSVKAEYKVLNALMNPHFVFNTLNNVQSLVNKEDKLASNEYLRTFADLIRQNMHNISFELIPLQKEIDLVTNYLKLEKLRFNDWLKYSVIIDEAVDTDEIVVPPLLIQPLVENAIKHGLLPMQSDKGSVIINIYQHKNATFIEVTDNGIGIETSLKNSIRLHESYGLDNIRKRFGQLSTLYDLSITLDIKETKDKQNNTTGTIAVICIHNTVSS